MSMRTWLFVDLASGSSSTSPDYDPVLGRLRSLVVQYTVNRNFHDLSAILLTLIMMFSAIEVGRSGSPLYA